jgi:hypothetical protein
VEWSLSIASVAVETAVSKPKVWSVPCRSLSIVFGTPMTGTPFSASWWPSVRLPSPPTATRTSKPSRLKFSTTRSETSWNSIWPARFFTGSRNGSPRLVVPRIVPPCATMPETRSWVSGMILLVSRRPA